MFLNNKVMTWAMCGMVWLTISYLAIIGGYVAAFYFFDYPVMLAWGQQLVEGHFKSYQYPAFFTHSHYQSVQAWGWLCILVISGTIYGAWKVKRPFFLLLKSVSAIISSFAQTLLRLNPIEKILLAGLMITWGAYRVFLYHYFPPHSDEIYSWTFFAREGYLNILLFYSEPNNHILHNLVSRTFYLLGLPEILSFRLPSILADGFLALSIFTVAMRYFGIWVAVFAFVFLESSFAISLHAIAGRGYSMLTCCSFMACVSMLIYLYQSPQKGYLAVFSLASIAGFFLIPTFLYTFAPLSALCLWVSVNRRDVELAKHLVLSHLTVIVGVAFLYLPSILFSGWDALFNNPYIQSKGWDVFFARYADAIQSMNFITGLFAKSYLAFAVLGLGLAWLYVNPKKDKTAATTAIGYFIISFFLTNALIVIAQHAHAAERVWVFGSIVFNTGTLLLLFSIVGIQPTLRYQRIGLVVVLTIKIIAVAYVLPRHWILNSLANMRQSNRWWLERTQQLIRENPESLFIETKADNFDVYLRFLKSEIPTTVGQRPKNEFLLIIPGEKIDIVPENYRLVYRDATAYREFEAGVYFFERIDTR